MREFQMRFDHLEPRRKKVAIVGFAESSRLKAPFRDQSWEVWAMNQLYRFIPRATRWWELHPHTGPRSYLADQVPGTDYLGWLKACPIPVYMVSQHPEIPNSIEYPLAQMIDAFDLESVRPDMRQKGYFHSSVDLMLALAISEGFEHIGIWGVDMVHDTEYGYQKPSGSFWLGVAKGRGVKLTIPVESALMNNEGYVYGYDPLPSNPLLTNMLARAAQIDQQITACQQQGQSLIGARTEINAWIEQLKQMGRGATVVTPSSATP